MEKPRVILVEPSDDKRDVLAARLRMQGYDVVAVGGAVEAAREALAYPPAAVIADLWMPSISGVQLCRLLTSEPATENVPIILRAPGDVPRNRFWAERAGAVAYVAKGRMGDLVRALSRAISEREASDGFFMQMDPEAVDIRDRISELLDSALFDSVLAAEVRALGSSENFSRLFDLFSQFLAQVTTYRWMAIYLPKAKRYGLHTNPDMRNEDGREAVASLKVPDAGVERIIVEDEDASGAAEGPPPLVRDIYFGHEKLGQISMAPVVEGDRDPGLLDLVARELGGPIRMAALVEEAHRLAMFDPLTGILNRRAFSETLGEMLAEAPHSGLDSGVSLLLLDVDHFKSVNDTYGHHVGDRVLSALGALLADYTTPADCVARWGGEEFVLAFHASSLAEARERGELLRKRIESLEIELDDGSLLPVSASIGLARHLPSEAAHSLLERADQAMYQAKMAGRNRLEAA